MRGKRRPPGERTSNVAGPLPPCKVCGQEGAGFHYGVNTCEACKGFFSRSLIRKEEYECLVDGNCPIMPYRRKSCPKCRYQKCLAVGMSKDAIKTGRYTYAKRVQDQQEIRQLARKGKHSLSIKGPIINNGHVNPFIVHEPSTGSDHQAINEPHAVSSFSPWAPGTPTCTTNSVFMKGFRFFETETSPSLFESTEQLKVQAREEVEEEEEEEESEDSEEHEEEEDADVANPNCQEEGIEMGGGGGDCESFDDSKSFSGEEFDRCCQIMSDSDKDTRDSTQDSDTPSPMMVRSLRSPTDNQVVMPRSAIMSIIISTKPDLPSVTLPPSIVNYTSSSWPCEFASTYSAHDVIGQYLREDQLDLVIQQLVASHRRHILDTNEFPEEYFEERIQQCLDECRLKQDLFGNMKPLLRHEFDTIFTTTGIDVDGRMANLSYSVGRFEEEICSIVAFCKTIPEFIILPLKTQVILVKGAISDICILGFYKGSDQERRIVVENNRSFCEHDIYAWEGTEKEINHGFKVMSDLKSLNLTFEMCVVLKTICLFNPERVKYSDGLLIVEQAYDKYVQCLNRLLQLGRQGLEQPMMSAIGSTIQNIRFQYLINRKKFHELRMEQYKPVYDSKATLEIFQ